VILAEPLQHQENASLSNHASSVGTKKSHKERGQVSNQQEENTHPPENHRKGNNCTGPTTSTLTTCELIQLQAQ